MKVNLSDSTLRVSLPQPILYTQAGQKTPIVIKEAVLRRMTAVDLSPIRASLMQSDRTVDNAFAVFVRVGKDIINQSVTAYVASSGEEVTAASVSLLTSMLPFNSAYKLMLWAVLFTRESSLIPTAYKCPECKATTIFDLDPEVPVPKNIEKERAFMEDFFSFVTERTDKKGQVEFMYQVQAPYSIDGLEEDADGKLKPEKIYSFTLRWPTLGNYLKVLQDSKKQRDPETWVLYESITRINEFSEDDTKALKGRNGFERIMAMKMADLHGLRKAQDQFGVTITHSFTCSDCGAETPTPFDFTNFFDYLMSTK